MKCTHHHARRHSPRCRRQVLRHAGQVRRAPTGPPRADLDRASRLVARVAAVIPAPGVALCRDDQAWAAFADLVVEAAGRVVAAVGTDGRSLIRALMSSPLGEDPLPRLLLEQALERLL